MSTPPNGTVMPLQAAQKIVAELTELTAEQQSLALKFAMETLGLKVPGEYPPPPPPFAAPPHVVRQPAATESHSTDLRTFTTLKAPKSDQQFAAVVAYFYRFEARPGDRKEAIDQEVMRDAARLAGRAQVQRWNMTLTNAKNAGYLDSAGNGQYKLSSVGENLVAITLPGEGGETTLARSAVRKPKAAPKKSAKKKK